MYRYTNYIDQYGRIMQFNKNKQEPVHRWYSFVEGYSKEFIQSIVSEEAESKLVCLDPFSGSGTTALELQNLGIKCYSFEVNPLMYLIGKVKLYKYYNYSDALKWFQYILSEAGKSKLSTVQSDFNTLYQENGKERWNLDNDVALAIEKLRTAIVSIDQQVYQDLYMVALSSILLDVSNLYRNGKCLSYKSNWKDQQYSQKEVFQKFSSKVEDEFLPDIRGMEESIFSVNKEENNYLLSYNEDCRIAIMDRIKNDSIDLVITSPPYLNSRDYTDTYMLELKALGFTKSIKEINDLRNRTIRSHVQVKWKDESQLDIPLLNNTLDQLHVSEQNTTGWNSDIINMVRLYFVDISTVFAALSNKVKVGGRVYFNVSNSAYYNKKINTLEICAEIAEKAGFSIQEIREARYLKTSPQQKESIGKLLEGVIVMERNAKHEQVLLA